MKLILQPGADRRDESVQDCLLVNKEKKGMNIIQVCIAFGIYLALYYCVRVMRGVQGLVMAKNILF